jgi:hypothetical protein
LSKITITPFEAKMQPGGKRPPGAIITPGDPDYNPTMNNHEWIRNLLGIPRQKEVSLPVAGYFLLDTRQTPNVAIFKNCELKMEEGRNLLEEELQPFPYLGEAVDHRRLMHLSMDDEQKVKPFALCPDPGLGNPMPNAMWMDPKEAKQR